MASDGGGDEAAVTAIVAAVCEEGVGQRYLIEHSAGSGKTNTIAWTAHRLARLHVDDTWTTRKSSTR